MKKILTTLAGVALVAMTLTGCSVAQSYVDKGVEKLSADNVEKEWDLVIRDWQGLTQAADNACQAQQETARDSNSPVLIEGPGLAYAATYRTVKASYNARQSNIFQADLVGPPGYPREIPNEWTNGPTPDFCSVSTQLADLKAQAEVQ